MWNNNNNNPFGNNRGGWNNNRGQAYVSPYPQVSVAERSGLVQKVMVFTFFSIIAAVAGVYFGSTVLGLDHFGGGSYFLFLILEIGLLIGAMAAREVQGLNFVLLYGFTFVTGLAISPVISLLMTAGYSGIVYQALFITAGMTLALSAYAWTTKRDFSGFAPYLFVAVIGLFIVGILNIFLHSTILYMVYLYAGVVIFSFYLIFDVQRVRKYQDTVGNAIALTISIYLDILNLFMFILQILMSMQGDRR
jgi:modulator of FtsH protease